MYDAHIWIGEYKIDHLCDNILINLNISIKIINILTNSNVSAYIT